jgi:hypothetical protein
VANEKVIYVENDQRVWFHVDLQKNCTGLETSSDLSLIEKISNATKKVGAAASNFVLIADHQKCPVARVQSMYASPWETYGIGYHNTY